MPNKGKRRRSWTYGSSAVVSSLLFLGILIFAVLIAERHPWRVDLTETGKYSLSEQTRKILRSLEEPIQIKAFYASTGPEQPQARELLETYSYYTGKVSYEFIDPDRRPEVARNYEVRSYGTLVLEGYGKQQTIQNDDEQSITNAILKLTQKEDKKIYFLTGHGEGSLKDFDKSGYASALAALEKENYKVEEWNLMQNAKVAEDAALLVIAGPRKPLFKEELESIRTYLDGGGKLLVLLEPYQDAGLKDFLAACGVELHDDIVIDKLSRVFGGSYLMPVVTQYGSHEITDGFNIATFYPEARSIRPMEDPPEGVRLVTLASTSADSWSEMDRDLLNQGQAGFDEKADLPGPVPLAVLSEVGVKKDGSGKPQDDPQGTQEGDAGPSDHAGEENGSSAYVVVFGDSSFVDNGNFDISGNGDLFLNAANFLAEEESLITIESREKKGKPVILTRAQGRVIFWTSVVWIPLAVIFAGLLVYRVRRSQR